LRAEGEAIPATGRIIVKRVKGFNRARKLLARENFWEPFTIPPRLAPQTKQVFLSVRKAVERIVNEVRDKGDKALFDYTEELDGVRLDSFEVSRKDVTVACALTVLENKELVTALEFAARRIRDFHVACGHKAGLIPIGKHLSQQIRPLDRVGLYVPGGTAAYPSTVLMMAIPAKVAGVGEIIMVSPPGKDGKIPASTLVAAYIAKVNRI